MDRIAKVLAGHGIASRRQAEAMIYEGRVQVNGKVLTTPACLVSPDDSIQVDGQALGGQLPTRLWVFHKPAGVITTHHDPHGRPTLFSLLPSTLPRVISIGRLDLMSEGLILLTTSGALARALEHPTSALKRHYKVRIYGRLNPHHLQQIENGLIIQGIRYKSIQVRVLTEGGANTWLEMILTEGKNREIRKIMEFFGYKVNRLIRTAYGPYALEELSTGQLREVDPLRLQRTLLGKESP